MLQAEPGAGKTTRVPLVLLDAGVAAAGEIIVAQPRRLAARLAAARVASLLGEPVGRRCGYQVRFDTEVSAQTKIRFVTEGILTRRLRDEPNLEGVSAVLLDEFHERHLDGDLALALLRRLQRGPRPELRIGVMSATLEPEPLAVYLGCRPLRCPGRTHPIEIEYQASRRGDRPLASKVAAAARELVAAEGSILVFLPGAREIREALEACTGLANAAGFDVAPLHGDLPGADQDRAVRPGARPKIIFATNVAETSITVEGVSAVIDSGLVRAPSHNPWSGIPSLTLANISRASATQRAGRAGRTGPGRCVRLYPRHDLERRPAFAVPEIGALDLSGLALSLRAAGLRGVTDVEWFEDPPQAAAQAAEQLLRRLGATHQDGALTPTGLDMLRYPLHPRLARLVVEARRRGVARTGAGVAAVLSERPVRAPRAAGEVAAADVLVDLAHVDAHPQRHRAIIRARKQLQRIAGVRAADLPDAEDAVAAAILTAYPDRVGRTRAGARGGREVVFAQGGSASIAADSVVGDAAFIVALDVSEHKGRERLALVRSAASVEAEWLLELFPDRVAERTRVAFDAERQRVEAVTELAYDNMVIDATALRELPPQATAALREAALAAGPAAFADPDALAAIDARTSFAAKHASEVVVLADGDARRVLARLCEGRRSFAEIRKADLFAQLMAELPPGGRAALERVAPTHATLPGRRSVKINYATDRSPWIESRLQDFFGSTAGPTIAAGAVPLVLHLLAPNQRAVQVTTDLPGFWDRHYPQLRRTLMRRYPKHHWPEDPRTAQPRRSRRQRS